MSLRTQLAAGPLVVAPGVWDAFSALMVQHLGFSAVYLGGNALGLSLGKAQPFLGAREVAEAVARIAASAELPIIADAATGFGDAAHVRHAVRDIEAAGAAALHFDDQVFPKRAHYFRGTTQLSGADDVARRLDQAVRSRRSDETLIIARSDVLRVENDIDRHIDRLRLYAETGVDGLMVLGCSPKDAQLLAREFPKLQLFWTATLAGDMPSTADLEGSAVDCALYPFHGFGMITSAMHDVWQKLRDDGRPGTLPGSAKEMVDLAQGLVGIEDDLEIEKRTLGLKPAAGH